MILADENIHGFIIKTLREAGFEVVSVGELASGSKDEVVIQMALQHNYLLLTEDKDFGEWVFAHGVKGFSVIFLRYSKNDTDVILKNVFKLIPFFPLPEKI